MGVFGVGRSGRPWWSVSNVDVLSDTIKTHQRQVKIPLVRVGLRPLLDGSIIIEVMPSVSPFIRLQAPPCLIHRFGDLLALRFVVAVRLRAASFLRVAVAIAITMAVAIDSDWRGSGLLLW